MAQQALFWFVDAVVGKEHITLAVAAFTARSARVQATKRVGRGAIQRVSPAEYAHAWVIDMIWPGKAGR